MEMLVLGSLQRCVTNLIGILIHLELIVYFCLILLDLFTYINLIWTDTELRTFIMQHALNKMHDILSH